MNIPAETTRYLIGVDNTDSAKAPGTGTLVRRLAEWLVVDGSAQPHGVTRHQLFANKHIPYTGRNSAVCLSLKARDMEAVWETARDFLLLEAVSGADVGLAMAASDSVTREVVAFGQRAKSEVLTKEEAQDIASRSHVRIASLGGEGGGVIGALAAIGLHRQGNDGRYLWLPAMPDIQGEHSVKEILESTPIQRVCSTDDVELPAETPVEVGEWNQPLLRNGLPTLLVEKKKRGWSVLDKERVKSLSE